MFVLLPFLTNTNKICVEMMEKEQQSQSERSMEHDKEEKQQKRGEPFKIQVCIYSLAKKNVSARPYICDSCGKTFKDRSVSLDNRVAPES